MKACVEQIHHRVSLHHIEILEDQVDEVLIPVFGSLVAAWASDYVTGRSLEMLDLDMRGINHDLREPTPTGWVSKDIEERLFPGIGADILYREGIAINDRYDIDLANRLFSRGVTGRKLSMRACGIKP